LQNDDVHKKEHKTSLVALAFYHFPNIFITHITSFNAITDKDKRVIEILKTRSKSVCGERGEQK
jgi:hypothetical protein